MLNLAIDTSTDQASVAVADDSAILAELSWRAGRNHSQHLSPVIERIFALAHLTPAELSTVTVAIGPGSFSGIRVGLSHAMGLSMALSIPLVGISTLDVIAFQASHSAASIWAVVGAGRDQVFAAHYTGAGTNWGRDSDYLLLTAGELIQRIGPGDVAAGPGIVQVDPEAVPCEPSPWGHRRAGFLAELGRRYLAAGGEDQLQTVRPLYLRRSAAEEKRGLSG
jgi:tRNA threonylcarbamoyladenosine biosynthesis protein TsaB